MLSALISSVGRQPAVPLAGQLAHESYVRSGPLVLGAAPHKSLTPTEDRDRTVSRRSKPSSRTALMGDQPNPWEVLPPQDATSRHRAISVVTDGADYLFTLLRLRARGRRLMATLICLRLRSVIAISPSRSRWISRYGVMSFDRLPTVLSSCEESTVISRFVRRVSTTSPQLEVPNHAVAVNAWA